MKIPTQKKWYARAIMPHGKTTMTYVQAIVLASSRAEAREKVVMNVRGFAGRIIKVRPYRDEDAANPHIIWTIPA